MGAKCDTKVAQCAHHDRKRIGQLMDGQLGSGNDRAITIVFGCQ